MRARGMRAARAKSASYVAEAKGLERRRGLTSFLIWTFFLAEVFGRDAIAPASAHTSEADEPSPARGNSEVAPATDELAARPMTGLGDQGESTTTISPGDTLNLQTPGRDASSLDVGDTGGQDATGARTVTHQSLDAGAPVAAGISSAGPDVMPLTGDEVAEPASLLHASLAPDGLLHGALSELPLVGGLLGDAVHAVASTVENLVGGLGGLLASQGSDDEEDAALASGGSIAFEPGSSTAPLHELVTPNGFTDYGIALESSLSGSSVLVSLSAPDIASFSSDHDAVHFSISDLTLADEAGQRVFPDLLA